MQRGDLMVWLYSSQRRRPVAWDETLWVPGGEPVGIGGPCMLLEWNDEVLSWVNWQGVWKTRSAWGRRTITYFTPSNVIVSFHALEDLR